MLKRSIIFLALATAAAAQQFGGGNWPARDKGPLSLVPADRPGWWKRHLGDSAMHAGATTADIISSRGMLELNPLLRNSRGEFGARGIAIKYGAFVAIESAKWALLRRGHRGSWVRALSLGPAGVYAGAAAHNWRIR